MEGRSWSEYQRLPVLNYLSLVLHPREIHSLNRVRSISVALPDSKSISEKLSTGMYLVRFRIPSQSIIILCRLQQAKQQVFIFKLIIIIITFKIYLATWASILGCHNFTYSTYSSCTFHCTPVFLYFLFISNGFSISLFWNNKQPTRWCSVSHR